MKGFVRSLTIILLALALSCLGLNGTANALPKLQLDIGPDAVYDSITETVTAVGPEFTLYAYGTPKNGFDPSTATNVYLSIALTPQTSDSGLTDFGSFTISPDDGSTVFTFDNTTTGVNGWFFGTPPYPYVDKSADLPSHGEFETHFAQFSVAFENTTTPYNTQDDYGGPAVLPVGSVADGLGMYVDMWEIDISELNSTVGLHFDLYALDGDGEIAFKAPFSHDAGGGPPVPEPATFLLVGSGLAALGAFRRRQTRK